MYIYIYIYIFVYDQTLSLSIYLPTYLPIYLSIYLSLYLSIYLSLSLCGLVGRAREGLKFALKYIELHLTRNLLRLARDWAGSNYIILS